MKTLGEYLRTKLFKAISISAISAVVVAGLGVAPTYAAPQNRDRDWNQRDNDHDRDWDHHDNDRDHRYRQNLNRSDIQRIAIVNGYSEGFDHGLSDRRSRRGFNYTHSDEYRAARSGYDLNWRLEREYQNWFRQAYSKGYSDAYYGRNRNRSYDRTGLNRYYETTPYQNYPGYYPGTPYGTNPNLRYGNEDGDRSQSEVARAAQQNGYNAGYQRGTYDAQQNNKANPQGHGAYQFGYDGWVRDWGWGLTYQQNYRAAFIRGYQEAYQRFDRDRNNRNHRRRP